MIEFISNTNYRIMEHPSIYSRKVGQEIQTLSSHWLEGFGSNFWPLLLHQNHGSSLSKI